MGNAGRIIKLYGTVANKGPATADTPHRLSRVLHVPSELATVAPALLSNVADAWALGPPPTWAQNAAQRAPGPAIGFDLERFLSTLAIPFTRENKSDGAEWFHLDHCPFNRTHGRGDSAICRQPDGRLGFKCFHDSCAGKDWHALRARIEAMVESTSNAEIRSPSRLPASLKPVQPLVADLLPSALAGAATDLADRLQCPIDYLAVAMLSAAGTVVGNRFGTWPLANDESWQVFPSLWGAIVGEPGTKKTPALQAAHVPLQRLQERAAEKYRLDFKRFKADQAVYERAFERWKKDMAGEAPAGPPTEPRPERFVVNDTTYQALGQILADNPRGVLALADELSGLLRSLDTTGQEAARGFYLTGWSGTSGYTFDRVGRGSIVLERYCLALFGGFQPELMKAYVRDAQRGSSRNDGLLQRFQLLVWPDNDREFKFVDRAPDAGAIDRYHQAIYALHAAVSEHAAAAGKRVATCVHFAPDAQQTFNGWYVSNEKMITCGKLDSARQSHFAKYRSFVPALSLLFHLVDCRNGPVCHCCTERAIGFAHYLKSHANRIYASVYGHDFGAARTLARRILAGAMETGFTRRALKLKGWSGLGDDAQIQAALDALVELGWLLEVDDRRTGGRPTTRYLFADGISKDLL